MSDQKTMQGLNAEDIKKCPECGSKDLERGDKETYCKKCGYVVDS